jgi:hypothetical protein
MGCRSTREVGKLNLINIEDIISNEPIKYSDIFSDFYFIPLETTTESILSNIDNIIFSKDKIFILNRKKGVYIFSQEGRYINKIDRIGRGPGEYLRPVEFDINPFNKTISILDWSNKKLFIYDFHGNFIKDIMFKENFQSFVYDDDKIYLSKPYNSNYKIGEKRLFIYSQNGNLISEHLDFSIFKKEPDIMFFNFGSSFFKGQKDIKFFTEYSDTIYSIKDNKVLPYIGFNAGKYFLSNKDLDELIDEQITKIPFGIENRFSKVREYSENDHLIFFKFNIGRITYSTFYSKDSGSTICSSKMIDDMIHSYPSLIKLYENQFVGIIQPRSIKNLKNAVADGKLNLPVNETNAIVRLPDDGNPIIVIFNVKNIQ